MPRDSFFTALSLDTQNPPSRFAIVGFAFRFPGDVSDEKLLWQGLLAGRDCVSEVDSSRWATDLLQHPKRSEPGRSITFSAGVLSRIDEFDASFFGISPREAAWIDPQQRLLLELAWESLENAGIPASRISGSDCAVYVGISGLDYGTRAQDDLASFSAHTMTGNTLSIAANRLSYIFDLHGPSLSIDTACSSSLVALHHACNCLRSGEASMAMVGGVNLLLHPYPFVGFTKASMLSAGGRCRTFDASGDGYVRAEGGAVVLIKPLEKAQADGDRIHAVILASGANADGARKTGMTIPSRDGQIELMRSVLTRSGIAAGDVDYLEAHGTGTAIGDPIETAAIGAVYGLSRPQDKPLPIGSIKTNLGHMEPASGMAGLIKAILTLKHRQIPPSLHMAVPNPKIDFQGLGLRTVGQVQPLGDSANLRPRVVGVNSFGFGGANAHVLLQEYPQTTKVVAAQTESVLPPLVLSARHPEALKSLAAEYALRLAEPTASAYDIAYAAAYRRDWLDQRLLVSSENRVGMIAALEAFAAGENPPEAVQEDAPRSTGELAFIYSGNGAQWLGMGRALLEEHPSFAEHFQKLEAPIQQLSGFSLREELFADAAVSRLDDTAVAQPLLFAIQVALTEVLREQGITPHAVAGHSVGEVAAAWAAGALTLDEAMRVISARSAAQALTRGSGRMAAVGLPESVMRELLAEHGLSQLEIAGINSPNNLTLSGPLSELQQVERLARTRGAAFHLLDLDYAFHSRAMDPVRDHLAQSLADLVPANQRHCIFVSTVAGSELATPLATDYWWDNVRQPVLFAAGVKRLLELGCTVMLEIGPHAILQRYLKECLGEQECGGKVYGALRKNDDGPERLRDLLLRLPLALGAESLRRFFPVVGDFFDLPVYPWQKERHWAPQTAEGYRLIERQRTHPLLGWRLKEGLASWENTLDPRTQDWLKDHQVGGAVVLPGAAYVEMALVAGREWFGCATQELEELDILAPVVFDEEHGRSIRLDLNTRDGSFQIRSRQRLSEDEWALNASGRLLGKVVAAESHLPLSSPSLSVVESLDRDTHYRLAQAISLDYGPYFQGLATAHVADDCLQGEFDPELLQKLQDDVWQLHPALLDVCFQSLLDFFRQEIEAGHGLPLLPVKVGRLRLLQQTPLAGFRTRILQRSLRSVRAEFELLAEDGSTVAILESCRFRAASLRRAGQGEAACWQIIPRLQPAAPLARTAALPAVHELGREVRNWLAAGESEFRRAAYFDEAQPLFDALVAAFAYTGMQTLFAQSPEEVQGWLAGTAFVSEQQQRLIDWARHLLREQGWLLEAENGWQLQESDLPPVEEIWRTLLAEYPSCMPELVLLGRIGGALPAMLAGRASPDRLLEETRKSHQFETLFDDALTYRGSRLAVERLISLLAGQNSPERRLRVLEIAAGLSEIPRHLAHALPTVRIDYVLAHSDGEACDHLCHEYEEDDWVTVADFDLASGQLKAKTPLPVAYDLIVLRHTLNAAADPRQQMRWAMSRLAAGGLVVIAERYGDLAGDLLFGAGTLLPAAAWQQLLQEMGCEEVEVLHEPAGETAPVGTYLVMGKSSQNLPVAAAEGGSAPENGSEANVTEIAAAPVVRSLLLAHDETALALAHALQQELLGRQQPTALHCLAEGIADRDRLLVILAAEAAALGNFDRVLYFANGDGVDDTGPANEVLNLVQTLAAQGEKSPQLTLVTRGGAPVDGLFDASACNPSHAAIWGLGRVVMNEYPGLACTLIDANLDPQQAATAAALADEILDPDGESEIILTPAARYVLRMEKTQLRGTQGEEGKRFRLDFRVPGQLRNLLWLESEEKVLDADEVEVQPVATGLNFRDVMYLMGLLPDEAVENGFAGASLGLEFSGVVTRVGSKVEEYAIGDAVMGFGSACFASHVVTRANALMSKPEEWSFEAAATVPTVFFTVYYALKQLANLQPGERVLIHGAAGGVGIAAVQLARHLGAEVFATAGSDEKREFVALLGADHVFDSRSLAFADQILARTNGEGVDVVLNSLAGEAIRRNLHVLRPFGRFLELGKRDFFENTPIGLRPFKDNISYFGIDADQLLIARPDLAARLFREVMALFRTGALSPLPYRAFAAERVVDAFRYMQQARQIGKVIVSFTDARITPQPLLPRQASVRFERDASYLVTGGITGFGLETARWLAMNGAGHLVLLSRRGAATPGAEEACAVLEAMGCQVRIMACDVAEPEALAQALAELADWPVLKGVFHAAMVIDDALIANLDVGRMARVLAPKVKGAWNLHTQTRDLPLDCFMLYSSVTTFIGNPGQANYVAANAWLEGLAVLRRAAGLPVTCIGWGPIGDAGYLTQNEAVKDSLANRLGAEALTAGQALQMLGRALASAQPNLAIADFQWAALSRMLPSASGPRFIPLARRSDGNSGGEGLEDFRLLIEGKSAEEIRQLVVQMVTQEVAQILAISSERIDPTRSLHDLGLDSLMGVELALGLEKRFGVQVPAMMLNEGPTVDRVTSRIVERLLGNEESSEGESLQAVAASMAAQHGEAVTQEQLAEMVASIQSEAKIT